MPRVESKCPSDFNGMDTQYEWRFYLENGNRSIEAGGDSQTFPRGNGTFTKWRGAEALAFRGK